MSRHYGSKNFQRNLQQFFDAPVVERGEECFKSGAVTTVQIEDLVANAEIIDSSVIQSTAIDWSQASAHAKFSASCTCGFFAEGNFCEHQWALVMELDRKNLTFEVPIRRSIQLVAGRAAVSKDSDWRTAFRAPETRREAKLNGLETYSVFIVMTKAPRDEQAVQLRFFASELDEHGKSINPKPLGLPRNGRIALNNPAMQSTLQLIAALSLADQASNYSHGGYGHFHDPASRIINARTLRPVLSHLLAGGNFFTSLQSRPLAEAEFGPLQLKVAAGEDGYSLSGAITFRPGSVSVPIEDLEKIAEPNLYKADRYIGYLDFKESERRWLDELTNGQIKIPRADAEAFLEAIQHQSLNFDLPEELRWEEVRVEPVPKIFVVAEKKGTGRHLVDLRFQYGPRSVGFLASGKDIAVGDERKMYARDRETEERIFRRLPTQLLVNQKRAGDEQWFAPARNLLPFVKAALACGIPVVVENRSVMETDRFQISVSSGLDWFDVNGEAQFDGKWVKIPAILEAVHRGESFVPLSDGTVGLISEEMAKKLEKLAAFAESTKDGLRFGKSQGLMLNSLLEDESSLQLDDTFRRLRDKIKEFEGIKPIAPVKTFIGQLRQYQKDGLGWLEFLEDFGLGGVLADDMGLGKTIQCLAFLEARRLRQKQKTFPSLLLAPKSLLQNWEAEAKKFTPEMKVLIHAGLERNRSVDLFKKYNLVVATYQTMLRDFETFRQLQWDCVILDEAQAIKNSEALIAKAAKLLPASFKLAMTGTPIENSIQDLFSISDFVNPGFLHGKRSSASIKLSDDAHEVLGKAFKPVVLRRTKEQVLKDLPEKTEQIIFVELEAKQLKAYNDLKRFYQSQLMKEVEQNGIKKSQIQILAALTRLRQAALHPGLINPEMVDEKSAKFEIVLEMLEEVISEGHRVLVFSQFTSLLALMKKELNDRKIQFSYLDGKTAKRQEVVESFKTTDAPVFLMSLKAGGVGLNLVEADYVFLLDPWWNPAVEAQAIDRVHRIGQKRAVNAYRFIAKNTVEEKILDLQKTKKGLAADLLGEKSNLIRSLTAKDIENLLS